jgi:hypothetical protein
MVPRKSGSSNASARPSVWPHLLALSFNLAALGFLLAVLVAELRGESSPLPFSRTTTLSLVVALLLTGRLLRERVSLSRIRIHEQGLSYWDGPVQRELSWDEIEGVDVGRRKCRLRLRNGTERDLPYPLASSWMVRRALKRAVDSRR